MGTVPGGAPEPSSLAAVLDMAGVPEPPPAPPGGGGPASGSSAAGDVVAPVWSSVGRVVDGGVVFDHPDGRSPVLLGPVDLRILDAVDRATTIGSVAERLDLQVADAADRIGWLVRAGRLTRGGVVSPEPQPEVVPALGNTAPEVLVASPSVEGDTGRIPVYSVWDEAVGPLLSLGMLTASARSWRSGSLSEHYDIRRPETASSLLTDLATRTGPAVLLCSDYVWSLEFNFEVARRAKAVNPNLVVIHGGPSAPKYPGDAEAFFRDHGDLVQVIVRGEGELVLCELLEALASSLPDLDPERARSVPGISFRDGDAIVRTPDQDRISTLDDLPSPYLTGEFDHIAPEAWVHAMSIETNRGCPYGCTFCDWGSATLSRIRKFDVDRIASEFEWAASRQINGMMFCDANVGILPRDVQIAERLADDVRPLDGVERANISSSRYASVEMFARSTPSSGRTSPPTRTSSWRPSCGGGASRSRAT